MVRLLTATDFALRTLMRMACEPDRSFTTDALADDLNVSLNHLQKVVRTLAEGGFVHTLRGPKGGVTLSRPPKDIPVGAVVRWFERNQNPVECVRGPENDVCVLMPRCRFHGMLAEAREAFLSCLDRYTLAECLKEGFPAWSAE